MNSTRTRCCTALLLFGLTCPVAATECDASVEADGYETTHLSLSVPDDDGITVEMTPAPAEDDSPENRSADDTQTAVQTISP